jgi:hypothetical protein
MTDALRLLAIFVFGNLFLAAFFVALQALFPGRIAQTRALAEKMPGRACLAGLINLIFFGVIVLVFSAIADWARSEIPRLPALLALAIVGVALGFGLAGVVELVGARVRPNAAPLARTVWGALVLSLGSTLPIVGWFALLPYAACLGLGAFIISLFYRERPVPPAA